MSVTPDLTPRSTRRGLTLVEVMAAIVLVAVGLLGIAGASSLSLRALAAHEATLRATRRASLRMASLEVGGCAAVRDGVDNESASGLRETWHVTPVNEGVAMVEDSLVWLSLGRRRQIVIRGALLC